MRIVAGTVAAGRVILEEGELREGSSVLVITRDDEADPLSLEELAELEAGLAEADRGDTVSGEELFLRLRRFG